MNKWMRENCWLFRLWQLRTQNWDNSFPYFFHFIEKICRKAVHQGDLRVLGWKGLKGSLVQFVPLIPLPPVFFLCSGALTIHYSMCLCEKCRDEQNPDVLSGQSWQMVSIRMASCRSLLVLYSMKKETERIVWKVKMSLISSVFLIQKNSLWVLTVCWTLSSERAWRAGAPTSTQWCWASLKLLAQHTASCLFQILFRFWMIPVLWVSKKIIIHTFVTSKFRGVSGRMFPWGRSSRN